MARTSRRKTETNVVKQWLEDQYSVYLKEVNERVNAGLVDAERILSFEEWSEDFMASNF